ncbi:MAG: hypothetical protein IJ794_08340 [Lachnospiraceae bacterium]|nr:hypothetical protein [Lachnospiraceae bacterium]
MQKDRERRDHRLFCFDRLEDICSRLEGKIYELPLGDMGSMDGREYLLLYERQCAEGTMQRFFCEEEPAGAVRVRPNLEDVFLVVYRDV